MKKKFLLFFSVVSTLLAFPVAAQVVVTESSIVRQAENTAPTNNWVGYQRDNGTLTFVLGPAAPPLGNGSLRFTTPLTTDKAYLFNYDHAGTPLSIVTGVSYSTFRFTGPIPQQVASINFEVFIPGPNLFTTLVFEPIYNPDQGPVVDNFWQTWNAFNGGNAKWWSTNNIPGVCADNCFVTWNAILAANPSAVILSFGVNQGIGNPGLISATDNLSITKGAVTTVYNFDFDPNDNPTNLTLSPTAIDENVPANTTVGTFTTTDPDAGDTFTYSLVPGAGDADNAAFNILGDALRINASPDFETKNSYSVRVRTTDQGGLWFEKSFTITIKNVNDAPSDIAISNTSIDENVDPLTTVGVLTTTDQDVNHTDERFAITYSLVPGPGDTDNGAFIIRNRRSLSILNRPDFETQSSYSVRIRTTDPGGLWFEEVFIITVNDLNEKPTDLALSSDHVNENVSPGTLVGTFSVTDQDAGDTHTYALVPGDLGNTYNNARFSITGDQLFINVSPNFERKGSYRIRVRATDQGGLFTEKIFKIFVDDVAERMANPEQLVIAVEEENSTTDSKLTGTLAQVPDPGLQLGVYPNPTTGTFNLELGSTQNVELLITDLSGKTVMQATLNSVNGKVKETLELKAAKGIYLLRIYADDQWITRKLIVE